MTNRRARAKHRKSDEGRNDHRDAERERRQRLRERVADQSSLSEKPAAQPPPLAEPESNREASQREDLDACTISSDYTHLAALRWHLHANAYIHLRADPSATDRAPALVQPGDPLQRASSPVCIACGRPGWPLVRVVGRPNRRSPGPSREHAPDARLEES